jgi:hypothetical protein
MPRGDSAAYWDWDAQSASYAQGRAPSLVDRTTLDTVPPQGRVSEIGCGPGVVTRQILAKQEGKSDPSEDTWNARLAAAGLPLTRQLHVRRREFLGRYSILTSPQAQQDLAWFANRPNPANIPMTLFCCESK